MCELPTPLAYFTEKINLLTIFVVVFLYKGRSTVDHIIMLLDTIDKYNNNNNGYTVFISLDFQCAFDMMWRTGFLIKLKKSRDNWYYFQFHQKLSYI